MLRHSTPVLLRSPIIHTTSHVPSLLLRSSSTASRLLLRHASTSASTPSMSSPTLPTTSSSSPLKTHNPQTRELSAMTDACWPHPIYTNEEMNSIQIAHRNARTWSDYIALSAVRLLRWGFDLVTGYKHQDAASLARVNPEEAKRVYGMTEEKWIVRFIFLESIAGVPGMVGGMVRHLHSLRCLRRDHGWIETLLEESQNERMHLLTFLKFRDPPAGWFMRMAILAGQGVFTNMFFFAYLLSPKTCHRFVGFLEEEAVITYTRAIKDLESGLLPKWTDMKAPPIAKDYFKMADGEDSVLQLLRIIRADEAKHREVNHTLANLDQAKDVNPYNVEMEGVDKDGMLDVPTKDLKKIRSTGWEREEVERLVVGGKVEGRRQIV